MRPVAVLCSDCIYRRSRSTPDRTEHQARMIRGQERLGRGVPTSTWVVDGTTSESQRLVLSEFEQSELRIAVEPGWAWSGCAGLNLLAAHRVFCHCHARPASQLRLRYPSIPGDGSAAYSAPCSACLVGERGRRLVEVEGGRGRARQGSKSSDPHATLCRWGLNLDRVGLTG